MPLNPEAILNREFPVTEEPLTDRDCMLYALSIGLGRDPLDRDDLRYVFEGNLKAFPTMPVVLGYPGNWMEDPIYGITKKMIVHGSQRLKRYKSLPIDGVILGKNQVVNLLDKGAKRGAIMIIERRLTEKLSGDLLAVAESAIFCRADGGFGKTHEKPIHKFQQVPEVREPDISFDIPTEANAALWYRLNGDRNPLHADPDMAETAGFDRPILHGLCTFGLAGVAIDKAIARKEGKSIIALETRFSQIVFPGETVTFDLWHSGNDISFRARVKSRASTVLDFGRATLIAE